MPMTLEGSCRCGAVRFTVDSHAPYPYQRCYCRICRKTAGGGGYTINIMGDATTLDVGGRDAIGVFNAPIETSGETHVSDGERRFCARCATALWVFDPSWPELVHPFASAIDTELPVPAERTHLMLAFKPAWVEPQIGPSDKMFDRYPDQSLEDWHRERGLWLD